MSKWLEGNLENTLLDVGICKIFLNRIIVAVAQEIVPKNSKWDYMKFKRFCGTKETISRVKIKPKEWEKYLPDILQTRGWWCSKFIKTKFLNMEHKIHHLTSAISQNKLFPQFDIYNFYAFVDSSYVFCVLIVVF